MLKRLFDMSLALTLFVVLMPVFVIVGTLVLLDDGWPVIFSQQRVGRFGKTFTCYKFRTMARDTGDHASHMVSRSAITRFGRIARATKLDELPQILNVLRGEMSFVGPRPCLPQQTELVDRRLAAGIYDLRPGITGLAQVLSIDMSNPEALVACEIGYLRNRSFLYDLKLLMATVFGKGLRTDAAQRKMELKQ